MRASESTVRSSGLRRTRFCFRWTAARTTANGPRSHRSLARGCSSPLWAACGSASVVSRAAAERAWCTIGREELSRMRTPGVRRLVLQCWTSGCKAQSYGSELARLQGARHVTRLPRPPPSRLKDRARCARTCQFPSNWSEFISSVFLFGLVIISSYFPSTLNYSYYDYGKIQATMNAFPTHIRTIYITLHCVHAVPAFYSKIHYICQGVSLC